MRHNTGGAAWRTATAEEGGHATHVADGEDIGSAMNDLAAERLLFLQARIERVDRLVPVVKRGVVPVPKKPVAKPKPVVKKKPVAKKPAKPPAKPAAKKKPAKKKPSKKSTKLEHPLSVSPSMYHHHSVTIPSLYHNCAITVPGAPGPKHAR